ncbi:MAG: GFA family protein [Pseudobdellovibrionaceae bacterium]|nr:GFA family protein [Pseudobdellovibrionaceae bacterium]
MFHGSCLCETVKFEVRGDFRFMGHCHCRICRKSHGSNQATQGLIDPNHMMITQGQENLARYASSDHYERFFCRTCGTRLFNAPLDRSFYSIALNVLDGDPPLQPNFHTYTRSKAPWVQLTDDFLKFDELPT